ncbi:MAG: hypothetical protein ACREIU_16115 [Planctomycetota bacterium]
MSAAGRAWTGVGGAPRSHPLPPLVLAAIGVTIFATGVLPAVRDARALAERRGALISENAGLAERLRLLREERAALPSDPFLNERMRRREFHAGPDPDLR